MRQEEEMPIGYDFAWKETKQGTQIKADRGYLSQTLTSMKKTRARDTFQAATVATFVISLYHAEFQQEAKPCFCYILKKR